MRLCEEYLRRVGIDPNHARHVNRGFLYYDGGERLLSIEWTVHGPHPGFYEISECSLGRSCKRLSTARVEWDDYERHLFSWMSSARDPVFDKVMVFDLTWQYFLRKFEDSIVGLFPLSEVFRTVDPSNGSRMVDCVAMVENLSFMDPPAAKFWHSKAFDIISLYCHWMARL